MLARLRKSQGQNEGGFTLIELLVVIIIIGILAAIAIPTFLNQRKKGWKSAIKSDLHNAAVAEESYATDSNGTYVGTEVCDYTGATLSGCTNLKAEGYNTSKDVKMSASNVTTTSFQLIGEHAKLTGCTITYLSATGTSTEVGC